MNWLRLWHDARTDRKLEALTDAQYRVFVNLLIFASEQPERGLIRGKSTTVLAVEVARGDLELLDATLERLAALEIVARDQDGVAFLHWDQRQRSSDNAAKRQRAYRESREAVVTVTPVSRDGHVTPPNCPVLDTDTETETETETEEEAEASSHDTAMAGETCIAAASPPPHARARPTRRSVSVASPERSTERSCSPRDDLADRGRRLGAALSDVLGFPAASAGERRRLETAARALARADPPVEPAELAGMKAAWEANYDVRCTPWTLADHVGELRQLATGPPPATGPPRRGRRGAPGSRGGPFRDDRSPAEKAREPVRAWRELNADRRPAALAGGGST